MRFAAQDNSWGFILALAASLPGCWSAGAGGEGDSHPAGQAQEAISSYDPRSDFRAGGDVYVNALRIEFDGNTYSIAANQLPKAPGSLTISVSLADLGLAGSTQVITLTGTQVDPSTIAWDVDQQLDPPIAIGIGSYADRLSGRIFTKIQQGSGEAAANCTRPPCRRNLTFGLAPGSGITLRGHSGSLTWTKPVNLLEVNGVGGLEQPTLGGMSVGASTVCARTAGPTPVSVSAWLNAAVTAGSTVIDFSASNPSMLVLPKRINLLSGSSRVNLDAYVQPGVAGQVTLTATSNGVKDSRTITVLAPTDRSCRSSM